jgi:MFS family permease
MRKFIENFKNRDFRLLWLAQVVSQFGDRINQMALIGLMASRAPGSAVGLAKILSFTILPVFLVGPVAGVYVDRWDRRTTLFVCDLIRGLLVLTIPFVFLHRDSLVPVYIVVFLIFSLSRFYIPAKLSIIPDLVKPEDLLVANSLVTVSGMIAFVLGAAFGGVIVEHVGPKGGFLWDAVTFFVSAGLVFSITKRIKFNLDRRQLLNTGKEMITVIRKSVIEELKEGVQYLVNHREIRFVINMMFTLFAAAGAVYVVIIVFVQDTFNSITLDFGLLSVFLGLGLFSGSLLYGRWGEKLPKSKVIFFCLIFGGLMLVAFAFVVQATKSFFFAALLSFLLGLIIGPIFIAANTVIHEVSHEKMRGKVFGGMEVVMHFAFLVTMFISSVLSERIEHFWILMAVGVIFALVGGIGMWRYRNQDKLI